MPSFDALPLEDQLFFFLALTILSLLGVAFLFGALTVVLRARNTREARLWAALESKWDPVILEVLAGTKKPVALVELVKPGEELSFLDYLLLYARRIRGEETAILEILARPFLQLLVERSGRGGVERRARAVQALGILGMPEHSGTLRSALDDPSSLVSMIAAQSLAEPEHPEFLGLVLERLHRYSDWHPAFLAGLLSDAGTDAGPLLRPALGDKARPDWVRVVIARALRNILDLDSADVAAEVLGDSGDPDLLVACLQLLVEVGESRHRDALIPLLESPHFPVRSYALKGLRTVGSAQDLPLFLAALEDESSWVAMEAARGLRALGALEPLQELAHSDGPGASLARQVVSE